MSPNCDEIVDATLLFVTQVKQRPDTVIANLNCLLEGEDFRLVVIPFVREPKTPAEASLFDFQQHSPQEQIRLEENHDGSD